MDITLMRFVGEEEARFEKTYSFEAVGFLPRKGDIIQDEGFFDDAIVEDVQINLDSGYCVVYLSVHDLSKFPEDKHAELFGYYHKSGWTNS